MTFFHGLLAMQSVASQNMKKHPLSPPDELGDDADAGPGFDTPPG
jgi:hypothetical protein